MVELLQSIGMWLQAFLAGEDLYLGERSQKGGFFALQKQ